MVAVSFRVRPGLRRIYHRILEGALYEESHRDGVHTQFVRLREQRCRYEGRIGLFPAGGGGRR